MVYLHKQFQLDEQQQIVYDEKGRELRILGNAYLMLAHLCQNKKATHKELAVLLGLGELYNGNRIVELMDNINGWIKDQVVQLKGEEYSIAGEVQKVELVHKLENQEQPVIEVKEEKQGKFLNLSWKMLVVIGIGLVVAIWLVKYILDLLM